MRGVSATRIATGASRRTRHTTADASADVHQGCFTSPSLRRAFKKVRPLSNDSRLCELTPNQNVLVDCVVGEWSEWSECTHDEQICGFKYGLQSRTREHLQSPSPVGLACPSLRVHRKCRMKHRFCSGKFVYSCNPVLFVDKYWIAFNRDV